MFSIYFVDTIKVNVTFFPKYIKRKNFVAYYVLCIAQKLMCSTLV